MMHVVYENIINYMHLFLFKGFSTKNRKIICIIMYTSEGGGINGKYN